MNTKYYMILIKGEIKTWTMAEVGMVDMEMLGEDK